MPTTQFTTILRITRILQTLFASGIGITAAGFSLAATLGDYYPHSVFYAVFTNGFIGLSSLVISCVIVAEMRQTDHAILHAIELLKATVATGLWFFSVEHLPWSLNMEDGVQKWIRSLIGGLLVV